MKYHAQGREMERAHPEDLAEAEESIRNLRKLALKKGAASARLIDTEDILVEDFVRQKCQYGCEGYATCFTCPPYAPTPEETRRRLHSYEQALLIQFVRMPGEQEIRSIQETMYELEREAFLSGLYKAFAYAAGTCGLCTSCPAEDIENPTAYSKRACRYQRKARPAMEACGINVFQTARKAGYDIDVVKEKGDSFKNFGLLLLR
jgi:predicted metal-binding protein